MTIDRVPPPVQGDERETLRAFLDFHRGTLALKCAGLTDEQLRRRASPPSTLSLLGLVRHLTEVERTWFRMVVDGEDIGLRYSDTRDYQVAYDASTATRDEAFSAWEDEVEQSRKIERAVDSLDRTVYCASWDEWISVRLVMHHMIHEYARHSGHADFLREAVDGTTGV